MVLSPLIKALLAVALFISLVSWPIAWASPGCWARR
jgi:hypothetical protein